MPMTPEQMEAMLEKLAESQQALSTGLQQMTQATQRGQELLTQGLSTLTQKINEGLERGEGGVPSHAPPNLKNEDLETMSRKELVDMILNGVTNVVDGKLGQITKDLGGQIADTRNETNRERIQREVDAARGKYKDFNEWRDEMQMQVKKNPMLSAEEAYILAKSGDSKKAKELDEKYAKLEAEEKAKSGEGSGARDKGGFGGMRPGTGERSNKRSDMKPDEAAEAAWDEIFGGRESELLSGELQNGAEAA